MIRVTTEISRHHASDGFMKHCVAKIAAIVELPTPDNRALLQLGYNLGRLSEITGLGREPFWDRWKDAVEVWDQIKLKDLAQELLQFNADSHLHLPTIRTASA